MAKKYRLLEQAKEAGYDGPGEEALEPDSEFDADLDPGTEQAMIAAGWIEAAEDKTAKGGKK